MQDNVWDFCYLKKKNLQKQLLKTDFSSIKQKQSQKNKNPIDV